MYIIIFGAPGVGKGTQAKILTTKLDIPHVSTGDILRDATARKTELGLKAKAIMDAGELVPDDVMIGIIRDTLSQEKCAKGFILDGFPRNINQAAVIDKLFTELKIEKIVILALEADDEEIVSRLTNRRACKECGQIFSIREIEDINYCPNCKAFNSFYQRNDDKEDVIRRRLAIFHSSTKPVLDYFEGKRVILHIDGLKPVDAVSEQILTKLKNLNF